MVLRAKQRKGALNRRNRLASATSSPPYFAFQW